VGPHRIGWALGEARSTVSAALARHRVPRLWELPRELVHLDIKRQGRIPEGGGHRLLGKDCASGGRVHQGLGYDVLHVAIDDCSQVA
jgi:hypothetical protein